MAKIAIINASKHFHYVFASEQAIVIGDTVHDIYAGKAVGAITIGVASGQTDTLETLGKAHPDLLVETLMDERVMTLIG